ncbi:hypothetical protein ACFLZ7_04445 [Nanoarchaeota archaeon]
MKGTIKQTIKQSEERGLVKYLGTYDPSQMLRFVPEEDLKIAQMNIAQVEHEQASLQRNIMVKASQIVMKEYPGLLHDGASDEEVLALAGMVIDESLERGFSMRTEQPTQFYRRAVAKSQKSRSEKRLRNALRNPKLRDPDLSENERYKALVEGYGIKVLTPEMDVMLRSIAQKTAGAKIKRGKFLSKKLKVNVDIVRGSVDSYLRMHGIGAREYGVDMMLDEDEKDIYLGILANRLVLNLDDRREQGNVYLMDFALGSALEAKTEKFPLTGRYLRQVVAEQNAQEAELGPGIAKERALSMFGSENGRVVQILPPKSDAQEAAAVLEEAKGKTVRLNYLDQDHHSEESPLFAVLGDVPLENIMEAAPHNPLITREAEQMFLQSCSEMDHK